MPTGQEYRVKAADLFGRARNEPNQLVRADCEVLALGYLRLADQADKNATTDIVYETPISSVQPYGKWPQQPQPKKKD